MSTNRDEMNTVRLECSIAFLVYTAIIATMIWSILARVDREAHRIAALEAAVIQTQNMIVACETPKTIVVKELDCPVGQAGCFILVCPESSEDTPGKQAKDGLCHYRLWCCLPSYAE